MAAIRFSHISKDYFSGTEAVKDFNLDVKDGEFLVLVGPSGCGKSTVLRIAAGLEDITAGELFFDEKVANELPPKKRNVAMVFQNYALFPNMTVEANMGFALKMQRVPKKERHDRVVEMAKILRIEELLPRKAKGLSGGQCQRIAIGRALVCKPNVFLLDEPLSNLDPSMRDELREEIASLQKMMKVTTLYVTHDLTEAMTLGDRVAVMKDGELQQVDRPQSLYLSPETMFVADFVGGSNMAYFDGVLSSRNGEICFVNDHLTVPVKTKSVAKAGSHSDGRRVRAGIRKEDLYPVCEGSVIPAEADTAFEALIVGADIVGSEKKWYLRAGDDTFTVMVRPYARETAGDTVTVRFAPERLLLFDPDTGRLIKSSV